jgi:hypothetical protein
MELRVPERVVDVERRPAGFVDGVLEPGGVLPERRARPHGAGVDHAPHRPGGGALPKDHPRRVQSRLRRALVLRAESTVKRNYLHIRAQASRLLTLVLVASCWNGVATRKTNRHPAMAGANVAAS